MNCFKKSKFRQTCFRYFLILFYSLLKVLQYIISYVSGGTECVCCGKHTYSLPLCKPCRNLFLIRKDFSLAKRCSICGKELISEQNTCLACKEKPLLLQTSGVYPLFSYRLWNKMILYEWKIKGVRTFSPFLAFLMHKALKEIEIILNISDIPIVPVPPRPGKIRQNGWDQIDELCRFLSVFYDHKIIKMLIRNSSEQQKKRTRVQRLEKIQSAYELMTKNILLKKLKNNVPKVVFLLDDVMTTGATVEKCATILKDFGIQKVIVATLFIVD